MAERGQFRSVRPGRNRLIVAAIALAWGLGGSAAPALDFTLHSTTVEDDGVTKEQLYFQDDATTRILISLPTGWSRTDGPDSILATPPNVTDALMRLEKSELTPATSFAAAGLQVYRDHVSGSLPKGATKVQWAEEKDNPLPLFGWKDREFTLTYEFYGQSFRRSVLFVNLNAHEQIKLTCLALKDGFDTVHTAGLDVLRSWEPTPVK